MVWLADTRPLQLKSFVCSNSTIRWALSKIRTSFNSRHCKRIKFPCKLRWVPRILCRCAAFLITLQHKPQKKIPTLYILPPYPSQCCRHLSHPDLFHSLIAHTNRKPSRGYWHTNQEFPKINLVHPIALLCPIPLSPWAAKRPHWTKTSMPFLVMARGQTVKDIRKGPLFKVNIPSPFFIPDTTSAVGDRRFPYTSLAWIRYLHTIIC